MGYGTRDIYAAVDESPLDTVIDGVRDTGLMLSVRIGPNRFSGTPALDDNKFEVYAQFDWDPADGGPSGRVYTDYERRIRDAVDIPERATWNGETYEFSLSLGCLTEFDDHPDKTAAYFDLAGAVPATSRVEENDIGHPHAVDTASALDRLSWYRELITTRTEKDGINASGGLWWGGNFRPSTFDGSINCDCCEELIPNGSRGFDAGPVRAWAAEPTTGEVSSDHEDISATLCLHCAAEVFDTSFAGDDRITTPDGRETIEVNSFGRAKTKVLSEPLYEEKKAEVERLRERRR